MTRMKGKKVALTTSCAVLGAFVAVTGVWAAQGGSKLFMNGGVASYGVRMINGTAYAPLADIARAQGMVVVPVAGGYEIKKAGGATPIAGLRGKIGDVLFDGKWRFQVLSLQTVDSYRMKYKGSSDFAVYHEVAELADGVFRPQTGRSLIAMKCRVTNGRNAMAALWVYNADTRTALADANGESYPPISYDLDVAGPFQSKPLVPGAKTDFTVLFSVPQGTPLKDLIFTLRTIGDKGNDARVSLGTQ